MCKLNVSLATGGLLVLPSAVKLKVCSGFEALNRERNTVALPIARAMLLPTFHLHSMQVTLLKETAVPSHGPSVWLVLNVPAAFTSGRTAQNVESSRLLFTKGPGLHVK